MWPTYLFLCGLGLLLSPLPLLMSVADDGVLWPILLSGPLGFVVAGVVAGRRLPPEVPDRLWLAVSGLVLGAGLLSLPFGGLSVIGLLFRSYGVWLALGAAVLTQRRRAAREIPEGHRDPVTDGRGPPPAGDG